MIKKISISYIYFMLNLRYRTAFFRFMRWASLYAVLPTPLDVNELVRSAYKVDIVTRTISAIESS